MAVGVGEDNAGVGVGVGAEVGSGVAATTAVSAGVGVAAGAEVGVDAVSCLAHAAKRTVVARIETSSHLVAPRPFTSAIKAHLSERIARWGERPVITAEPTKRPHQRQTSRSGSGATGLSAGRYSNPGFFSRMLRASRRINSRSIMGVTLERLSLP